jgi:hypothetical protein
MAGPLPSTTLVAVWLLVGCGAAQPASTPASLDGGTEATAAPPPAQDASPADVGSDVPDARATLTVSVDSTLDQDGDDTKVQSIHTAALLDASGATVSTATVGGGMAVFDLTPLKAGDYFVVIDGDMDDLVPTRIDDPSSIVVQRVGSKLRASYIGSSDGPTYRINTYSSGQSESPVVRYSDGTVVAGETALCHLHLRDLAT